jgi:hypothetical protein
MISSARGDTAHVRSEGIGIQSDGTSGSVVDEDVYEDIVRRTPAGWRIATRKIIARASL